MRERMAVGVLLLATGLVALGLLALLLFPRGHGWAAEVSATASWSVVSLPATCSAQVAVECSIHLEIALLSVQYNTLRGRSLSIFAQA